jgi:ABC-2 type transport system permease protein
MLLASATPFELVAGKVLAALGRSLTSAVVYIAGAIILLNSLAMIGLAPLELLPWFLIYLIAEVTMLCALATGLGAACGSPQDAQSLGVVLLAPVLIPLFFLMPAIQQPNGPMATGMSLFPLFSPVLMLLRQAMPGGVPWWQPWVGLTGALAATVAICWIAARIFRIGVLLQGKPPNVRELMRWAVRG